VESVESSPVAVLEDDLNVLDRIEIDPVLLPYPNREVSVERTPLELRAHILLDEGVVIAGQGVRDVTLGCESAGVLNVSGKELRNVILTVVVAYDVGAEMNNRVGYESGRVAGGRK
jgi:hypothetical protein